jgi:hypothetical protein
MKTSSLMRNSGVIVALAVLSACAGGSQVGSQVAPSVGSADATHVSGRTLFLHGRPVTAERVSPLPLFSQLVPVAAKSSKNYEYVINYYGSYASMFNYPKSSKMIGQLQGAGGQGCTNVEYGYGKGIIWNAGRTNDVITEYSVPQNKVLKTLPTDYDFTSSCAMNADGDLAVGVLLGNSYQNGGEVVIYKKAKGKGKVYQTPLAREFFDGYDAKGYLFADGFASDYSVMLVELPKGAKKFVTVTTSNSSEFPGSVQWDGKYLSMFDQGTNEAYQYSVSGTTATLENTVTLSGAADCAQTWIVPGLIYCGDAGNNNGAVYPYPAGGSAKATFTGDFDEPLGVVAADK